MSIRGSSSSESPGVARRGSVVSAAAQRDGHLYVHTNDMTVAVEETVFLVNAGADGSRGLTPVVHRAFTICA